MYFIYLFLTTTEFSIQLKIGEGELFTVTEHINNILLQGDICNCQVGIYQYAIDLFLIIGGLHILEHCHLHWSIFSSSSTQQRRVNCAGLQNKTKFGC